jgi:hypothetical protein
MSTTALILLKALTFFNVFSAFKVVPLHYEKALATSEYFNFLLKRGGGKE